MLMQRRRERGDTLIEVLFATAVFSLVAVGSLSIMNQGSSTAQRSLEITLVRQQIDAQSQTLHFLNASFIGAYKSGSGYSSTVYNPTSAAGQWALMGQKAFTATTASDFGLDSTGQCPAILPSDSFILDTKNAKFVAPGAKLVPATTYSRLEYGSDGSLTKASGIWIEAIRSKNSSDTNQAGIGYIDFHINACWNGPGQSPPVTLGTIVRLYEPRG